MTSLSLFHDDRMFLLLGQTSSRRESSDDSIVDIDIDVSSDSQSIDRVQQQCNVFLPDEILSSLRHSSFESVPSQSQFRSLSSQFALSSSKSDNEAIRLSLFLFLSRKWLKRWRDTWMRIDLSLTRVSLDPCRCPFSMKIKLDWRWTTMFGNSSSIEIQLIRFHRWHCKMSRREKEAKMYSFIII